MVATAGDVSVVAFREGVTKRIYLRKSDGRGLDWTPLVRVDSDDTGAQKRQIEVVVQGHDAFVAWIDQRHDDPKTPAIEEQAFWNTVDLQTMSSGEDKPVDVGTALDGWTTSELKLAHSTQGAVDAIHLALRMNSNASLDGQIALLTSLDHGTTLLPAIYVAPEGVSILTDSYDVACRGPSVYVVWGDDRVSGEWQDQRLYLQMSDDYAAPGSFLSEDVLVFEEWPGTFHDVELDASEGRAAAAWVVETPSDTSLHARSYASGGGGLSPLATLVGPSFYGVHEVALAIEQSSGNTIVAWEDHVLSADWNLRTAVSADAGETFSSPTTVASFDATGLIFLTVGGSPATPLIFVGWPENAGHLTLKQYLASSVSLDLGSTWEPAVRLSTDEGGIAARSAVYNSLYRNLIISYSTSVSDLFIGGFRPQTVEAVGFEPGSAATGFDFELFDAEADPFAWALLSFDHSDLIQLEGKILGLLPGSLLTASLGVAASGTWAAELDAEGAGSTSKVSAVLPAGVTLYAVGLGLDLQGASAEVGSITDVVEIEL